VMARRRDPRHRTFSLIRGHARGRPPRTVLLNGSHRQLVVMISAEHWTAGTACAPLMLSLDAAWRYTNRVKIAQVSCLTLLTGLAVAFSAEKVRDWKIETVLDAASAQHTYTTGATTNANTTSSTNATTTGTVTPNYGGGANVYGTTTATTTGNTNATTTVHRVTVTTNSFIIAGADYVYTVLDSTRKGSGLLTNAIANRKHGCRFIIGDQAKYAQEKKYLYVLDADGKECKLDITRHERASAPAK